MTDKKAVALAIAKLAVYATTSAAATAVTNVVTTKLSQRRARKEAAANLCLNED